MWFWIGIAGLFVLGIGVIVISAVALAAVWKMGEYQKDGDKRH